MSSSFSGGRKQLLAATVVQKGPEISGAARGSTEDRWSRL
jgi:hypothetical protein